MKLYEITPKFAALLAELENADAENFEAVDAELERCEMQLAEKLDNIARILRSMEAEADAFQAEAERLQERADIIMRRHEHLKNYIGRCLPPGMNLKTSLFAFSWRETEAIEIDAGASLPPQYVREKFIVEPDKRLMAQDLKCGATIPGAKLTKRFHLQVK